MKLLIEKKLSRIKANPHLSKPLKHEPNCFSERIKNFRIVFEVSGSEVLLYRVKKRDEAYVRQECASTEV
jgi:mRNA-degrading endonuclease RelE of RelBE toxin-antitoxin system